MVKLWIHAHTAARRGAYILQGGAVFTDTEQLHQITAYTTKWQLIIIQSRKIQPLCTVKFIIQ